MDIRHFPKVLILVCAVIYINAGTKQEEKSLEMQAVGTVGNSDGAQNDDTVVTPPQDAKYKLSYADYKMTWDNFKLRHNKTYSSTSEETRRFAIFMETVKEIEAHNMKYHLSKSTYWMDINHFSDWTREEILAWLGPRSVHSRSKRRASPEFPVYRPPADETLPEAIDWRDEGYVTDVKNQNLPDAKCGSCYAFSTTGAVEGQWKRERGKLINLSEQQIVDCAKDFSTNEGCDGGDHRVSFEYITYAGGLQSEATYPYVAKEGPCKFNKSKVVAQIEGYVPVRQAEKDLMSAVATRGPVSVSVFFPLSIFKNYKADIVDKPECMKGSSRFVLDHAVLVVGYGTDNRGKDFWIVKNCWGSNWGDNGYFRLVRGKNMCGIADEASFPIVKCQGGSNRRRISTRDVSNNNLASCPNRSNKLENNAIIVLVTLTLVFLRFTQLGF